MDSASNNSSSMQSSSGGADPPPHPYPYPYHHHQYDHSTSISTTTPLHFDFNTTTTSLIHPHMMNAFPQQPFSDFTTTTTSPPSPNISFHTAPSSIQPNTTTSSPSRPPPKNPRKRSRASRRAPTTVLTTDTTNFRAMVQEFTGIPTHAAPSSSPFSSIINRESLLSTQFPFRPSPQTTQPIFQTQPPLDPFFSFLQHQLPGSMGYLTQQLPITNAPPFAPTDHHILARDTAIHHPPPVVLDCVSDQVMTSSSCGASTDLLNTELMHNKGSSTSNTTTDQGTSLGFMD